MVTLGVGVPLPGGDLVLHEEGRALQVVVGPGVGQQAVGPHLAQALQGLGLGKEDGGAPGAGRAAVRPFGAEHARAEVPRGDLPPAQRQPHQVRVAAVARAGRAARSGVITHRADIAQVRILVLEPRGTVAPPVAVSVVGVVPRGTHRTQRSLPLQHGAVRPGAQTRLAVDRQRAAAVVAAGAAAVAETGAAAVVVLVAEAPAQVGQRGPGADVAHQGTLSSDLRYAWTVRAAGSAAAITVTSANYSNTQNTWSVFQISCQGRGEPRVTCDSIVELGNNFFVLSWLNRYLS